MKLLKETPANAEGRSLGDVNRSQLEVKIRCKGNEIIRHGYS